MRHVVMFSSGAGSAIAAARVIERYDECTLLFADVNGEHPDNYRFLDEMVDALGVTAELVVLDNDGKTIWDVFRESRFLANTRADVCSRVLKREPMRRWLEDNCDPDETTVHLGFDWTEAHRWERAQGHWDPWKVDCPLMWKPMLDKAQVLDELAGYGIEPPLLTRQGYPHANCKGGCVKAGMAQWRKLLRDDPDTFAEWETGEQSIRDYLDKDAAILRDRTGGTSTPLPLSEFRRRIEVQPELFDTADDWGSCNCMGDPTDEVQP